MCQLRSRIRGQSPLLQDDAEPSSASEIPTLLHVHARGFALYGGAVDLDSPAAYPHRVTAQRRKLEPCAADTVGEVKAGAVPRTDQLVALDARARQGRMVVWTDAGKGANDLTLAHEYHRPLAHEHRLHRTVYQRGDLQHRRPAGGLHIGIRGHIRNANIAGG